MNKPSTTLIIRSSCGKTYALLYIIIEKEYPFDYILILCPTI